jgi:hypothetical protein
LALIYYHHDRSRTCRFSRESRNSEFLNLELIGRRNQSGFQPSLERRGHPELATTRRRGFLTRHAPC